jgi:hypothetical protein
MLVIPLGIVAETCTVPAVGFPTSERCSFTQLHALGLEFDLKDPKDITACSKLRYSQEINRAYDCLIAN